MGMHAGHHTPSQAGEKLQMGGSCPSTQGSSSETPSTHVAYHTRWAEQVEGAWELEPYTLGQELPSSSFPLPGWVCGAQQAFPWLLSFPVLPAAWSGIAGAAGGGTGRDRGNQGIPGQLQPHQEQSHWEAVCMLAQARLIDSICGQFKASIISVFCFCSLNSLSISTLLLLAWSGGRGEGSYTFSIETQHF